MKKLTVVVLLLTALHVRSQDIVQTKDAVVFYELRDSTAGTKDQLYSKAKAWVAKVAASAKEVIQMDDPHAGTLVGKGYFNVRTTGLGAANWPCYCTMTIDCRDQKFRIQLSNFYYMGGEYKHSIDQVYDNYSKGKSKAANGNMLKAVDKGASDLMSAFASAMKSVKDDF